MLMSATLCCINQTYVSYFTFQILHKWHSRKTLTVKDVVTEMEVWTHNGYLDAEAVKSFGLKRNESIFPVNLQHLQLPVPPSGPHPLQLAMMVNFITFFIDCCTAYLTADKKTIQKYFSVQLS